MTITRWLFSRARSAVTCRASSPSGQLSDSPPGDWGWAASEPTRPLLALRLRQRPSLPDGSGSTMLGTEQLRLTGRPRGRLPWAWAASSWEAYLEQSSRTSGQLKVSVSKGLRGLRLEGRVPGEAVLEAAAGGLKEERRGDISPAEQGRGRLCSWASSCSWSRDNTGLLLPVRREVLQPLGGGGRSVASALPSAHSGQG